MNLVETLVEIVQHLELVLCVAIDALDLLDCHFRLSGAVGIRLVERQNFLLLSFKLPAKFGCLQDPLT